MPRYGAEYSTNNLFEATFLNFKGFRGKSFRDEMTGKTEFSFTDTAGIIESLLEEFWNASDELRILETFRTIKRTAVGEQYKQGFYKQEYDKSDRVASK